MNIFNTIINTGVTDALSFPQKRKITLINYVCVITAIILLAYLPLNIVLGLPPFFYLMNLLGQVVLWLCIYLNYKHQYNTSKVFTNIALLLFINGFAILAGEGTGTEYINIFLCALPLVIFDKKKFILLFSLLSVLFFIVCKIVFVYVNPLFHYPNAGYLFYVNIVVIFLSIFYLLNRFKMEIVNYSGLVEQQHEEISQKNKEITDSIRYAKNIQNAVIGNPDNKLSYFKDVFILFHPKDIVSGDFFWASTENEKKIIVAADCTGHGIPGALMTIMGKTFLDEIINDLHITSPETILAELDKRISKVLKREKEEQAIHDGMDISVLCIDEKNKKISCAAAHHTIYRIRNGELQEIKGSDFPIGSADLYENKKFELNTMDILDNDRYYIGTDGYADQFGGANNKKFSRKQLKKILLDIHTKPMEFQRQILMEEHIKWKGVHEQTDDVLVIGINL